MAFSSKGACFVRVLALHLCLLCGPLAVPDPLAAVVFGGLGLLLDALGCLGLPLASFGASLEVSAESSPCDAFH